MKLVKLKSTKQVNVTNQHLFFIMILTILFWSYNFIIFYITFLAKSPPQNLLPFFFLTLFIGELESYLPPGKGGANVDDAKRKIVRFGRGEGRSMEEDCGWSEAQLSGAKDSGIDTGLSSSGHTLNEDWRKVILRTSKIPDSFYSVYVPNLLEPFSRATFLAELHFSKTTS